jgi:hypothetical protein
MSKNLPAKRKDDQPEFESRADREKFMKASIEFADKAKLDLAQVRAAYRHQPELLIHRHERLNSNDNGIITAFLISAVGGMTAAGSLLGMMDSHHWADAPYVSLPISVFFGMMVRDGIKSKKQIAQAVKDDVQKQLGAPAAPARLPPPAPRPDDLAP